MSTLGVHQGVGGGDQTVEGLARVVGERDPGGELDRQLLCDQGHRGARGGNDPVRHLLGVGLVLDVPEQDDELVATHACHGVSRPDSLLEPVGHLAQHMVAGVVSVPVVDQLEAVQIEVDHRHPTLVAAAGVDIGDGDLEAAVVEQPGERIGVGLGAQLVGLTTHPHRFLADVGDGAERLAVAVQQG